MKKYKEAILSQLIDKYERSKSFIGKNEVNQSFSIDLVKAFPEYGDDAKYNEIQAIDHAVTELSDEGWVRIRRRKNGLISAVTLEMSALQECYTFLKRKPKKNINEELSGLLMHYRDENEITRKFCSNQLERLSRNKRAEYFVGDIEEYELLLKALSNILSVDQETYERDFSVRTYGDSKIFEKIRSTIVSVLYEYGEFSDRETVLEDLNIVKNPGHVYFKGPGIISISGQRIDLNKIHGDLAVSSKTLKDIDHIIVTGNKILTIENLTTFNVYIPDDEFVIYLGGYHNAVRREFIVRLHQWNPDLPYYHYGDIDAGGFYILQHLKRKTGVKFIPFRMNIETLKSNMARTKKLTENDKRRLNNLLGSEYDDVVKFMLENNCKLEQENLD